MVIERSNHIFTGNPVIARSVEEAYSLSRDKLVCLEDAALPPEINSANATRNNLLQSQKD
ncbi:hypothetical protein [Adhaeribacter pallidiroseus]|uniref:Uncharacterized protein n=1 Tax=Adhaeribacter pallidiroseus TaxID=2072847 RepID=A0A369QJJ6_9BACT|nr:hypothetical protein [Adhaeribacter pallidiroseus]RDC64562.1 hypothetical protein AHMF7616_03176 [Adhaeribacter pallidiroseus]